MSQALTWFNVFKFFHILTAIVGFGWLLLVKIQFRRAGEDIGPEGAATYGSAYKVTGIANIFVYLTGVFGVATAIAQKGAFKQPWLSASMAIYVVALVVSLAGLQPAERKLARLYAKVREGGGAEATAEITATNKRVAALSGVFDLLFVVMLVLMVFKWPSIT